MSFFIYLFIPFHFIYQLSYLRTATALSVLDRPGRNVNGPLYLNVSAPCTVFFNLNGFGFEPSVVK